MEERELLLTLEVELTRLQAAGDAVQRAYADLNELALARHYREVRDRARANRLRTVERLQVECGRHSGNRARQVA